MEEYTNIERIIAKIDNDFNPDNSDWIPRVGAWVIDALGIIGCTPTEKRRITLNVKDKIAYSNIPLNSGIKVYDENGCLIKKLTNNNQCCNHNVLTGSEKNTELSNTMSYYENKSVNEETEIATQINGVFPARYNVVSLIKNNNNLDKNYVIVDKNTIELNYDAKCIVVEVDGVKTEHSGMCGCELPVIPNNSLLIEAIAYYCMYKMLCRGYKHQVFNLNASQYGTNPYFIWTQLKDKAKRSVINEGVDMDVSKLWRSAFFVNTFDPRR